MHRRNICFGIAPIAKRSRASTARKKNTKPKLSTYYLTKQV